MRALSFLILDIRQNNLPYNVITVTSGLIHIILLGLWLGVSIIFSGWWLLLAPVLVVYLYFYLCYLDETYDKYSRSKIVRRADLFEDFLELQTENKHLRKIIKEQNRMKYVRTL